MDVSKYAALFVAESRQHLRACDNLILEWEREPSATEPVDGLFRAVHTVKGMAAAMGYGEIADLSHRLETMLDQLRGGKRKAGGGVFDLMFRSIDALKAGVEAAAGESEMPRALAEALEALDDADGESGEPVAEDAPAAAPASDDDTENRRRTGADRRGKKRRARDEFADIAVTVPVVEAAPKAASGDEDVLRLVRVGIRAAASMRGARALLALKRAESLGAVTAVRPAPAKFERDEFDGRFEFLLSGRSADADIEAAIKAAGEVETVRAERTQAAARASTAGALKQIRVDLRRLDRVGRRAGELLVAKNRLLDLTVDASPALRDVAERTAQLVAELHREVMAVRLAPAAEVLDRLPRLGRDLGRELGKQIAVLTEGGDIELDRAILDEIADPLVHLLRNAVDHGIEAPADRAAAGKPSEGRLVVSALRERNAMAIRVTDDGRGIDRGRILAKAHRDGAVGPEVTELSDDALLRVIARPGFSTAGKVSEVSGRGVGVDIVFTRVRMLGGTLEVKSEVGKGTTFIMRVPLTLAVVPALLAAVGEERYAVPVAFVAEMVAYDPARETNGSMLVRDRPTPVVDLRELVRADGESAGRRPAIVLELGERRAALIVDAVLGQQEIVVEPFDAPRAVPPYVGGATVLADGAPALILDAAALV